MITQNSSKQYVPEIENALEQKFEMESILANVPITAHPVLKTFFNSALDLKREKQELRAQIVELQNENKRLQKEVFNEEKARIRLSDSNASFTKLTSQLMLWLGNLTSVFWLCKDFGYVSKIDCSFVCLTIATSLALFNTIFSIITWCNNNGQMDKIEKDYQAGRSESYKKS